VSAAGRHRFASLRWRISLAITAVVLLCTTLCVTGAYLFLRSALTDRATAEMRNSLNGVSGYISNQTSDLLGAGRLLAFDPAVIGAARGGGHQALVVHLTPLFAELNVDLMDVTGADGRVLVRMEDTIHFGDRIDSLPSVRRALAGNTVLGPERDALDPAGAGAFALRATLPIRSGGRVIGVVVVGRELDNIFAGRLGHALSADVNLIAGNQRAGTTLTDSHGLPITGIPVPTAVLDRIARGRPSIVQQDENGQPVLSGLVPLANANGRWIGAVEVVKPLGPVLDVARRLTHLLVALGALVVILGMVLALLVSRRVTSRLRVLDVAASRIAHRAATDPQDAPSPEPVDTLPGSALEGYDEVASLARSFDAMVHALDERNAASQARVRELTGLAEIARLLTAAPTLHETVELLGERLCALTGGVAVAMWLRDDVSPSALLGGYGLPPTYESLIREIAADPVNQGFETGADHVMRTGEPHSTSIADSLPQSAPASHRTLRGTLQEMGARTSMSVPLRLQDRIVGALSCYFTADPPQLATEMGLLTTIADQVAVAVENARLHAQARDLAALEERQRLARELHDSVSQALYGIALGARTARITLERDPAKAAEPLEYVLAQAEAGLTEMRALIFELRPETLAAEGLVCALGRNADALQARHGISVQTDLGTEPDISLALKETLHRIAQEALHNIVKHSGARHVSITLASRDGSIDLDVRDDGRGFDATAAFPGHLGLRTMRERAVRLGGTLAIDSAPGSGTHLHLQVPVLITEKTVFEVDRARLGESPRSSDDPSNAVRNVL
jgi:signal transduction histidine kinase